MAAIRYGNWKVTFLEQKAEGLRVWQDPFDVLRAPLLTKLRMDPFERQTGDVNRQYAERKTWVLTPIVGIAGQHLESFKEFPIRQLGLSAQFGKTLEGIQSQILKIRPQQ